jgi:hypothetical protein
MSNKREEKKIMTALKKAALSDNEYNKGLTKTDLLALNGKTISAYTLRKFIQGHPDIINEGNTRTRRFRYVKDGNAQAGEALETANVELSKNARLRLREMSELMGVPISTIVRQAIETELKKYSL